MNIPDEVVEAAAQAAFASAWRGCRWDGRDGTTEETRERFRREVRAALESAAPRLMAQALEEVAAQVIPDEAVEAATMAIWGRATPVQGRNVWEPIARAVLEAAAPHIVVDLQKRDEALTRVEGLLHVWESTNSPFSEMRIHYAVESIRLAMEDK